VVSNREEERRRGCCDVATGASNAVRAFRHVDAGLIRTRYNHMAAARRRHVGREVADRCKSVAMFARR